jgi:transposase
VPLCEPVRIIAGEPYPAGRIHVDQRLQWQIDADCLVDLHERRAGFGAAEYQELSWSQRQTDFCGSRRMIDASKHGHALPLVSMPRPQAMARIEAVRRLFRSRFSDGGRGKPRWFHPRLATRGGGDAATTQGHTTQKGFVVLPRRWVVERTFSWFGRNRRIAKDYENLAETPAAFVTLACIQIAVRRLAR